MAKSGLTKVLENISKQLRWPENKAVGYQPRDSPDKYYNPLLTPPPRSPRVPEDFLHPERLGHWRPYGYDYESPKADAYMLHEAAGTVFVGFGISFFLWMYGPDYKMRDWAKREAFLRTHKREALGIPLIDRNVVDPDRVVLPTEEELGNYRIHY